MFVLRIAVTPSAVEAMKAELTRNLPDVKSSHRVEALARGLGFRTYAALRAAPRSPKPSLADVTGALFSSYLKEHGFEVDPAHLYRAAAYVAIQETLKTEPKLHIHGIGFGRPHRNADGSWPTQRQRYDEFQTRRRECLGTHATEAFLLSLAFLAGVKPTKTIRRGTGSYRLKHIAENYVCTYPEGERLGPAYVPNGMLIAAALHMGFKHKTHLDDYGYDEPNATFNMSKPNIDDLDADIRPRSGYAQDRARRRAMRTARRHSISM